MNMQKSKKVLVSLLLVACIGTTFATPAFAGDDNIPFSFTMKESGKKSYLSGSRYRETTRKNNPWKVEMTYSSEGKGTVAQYFLASGSSIGRTQLSDIYSVKQGAKPGYYKAYASAEKRNVTLGVKNNNIVPKSYTVSGYWDEETGGTI